MGLNVEMNFLILIEIFILVNKNDSNTKREY